MTSSKPSPLLQGTPTFVQTGLPDYVVIEGRHVGHGAYPDTVRLVRHVSGNLSVVRAEGQREKVEMRDE